MQQGQGSKNRAIPTKQQEQGSYSMVARMRQQDMADRTWQIGHGSKNTAARTGQKEEES
jgi:hypothetical protein